MENLSALAGKLATKRLAAVVPPSRQPVDSRPLAEGAEPPRHRKSQLAETLGTWGKTEVRPAWNPAMGGLPMPFRTSDNKVDEDGG